MKLILFIVILFSFLSCKEKVLKKEIISWDNIKTIDSTYIASKTSYFTINDFKIEGNGLDTLNKIIKESQFFFLGERHGSSQISNLTAALIPMLSNNGYDNFALEVGPNTALKLAELSSPPENTIENLKQFNTKYYNKPFEGEPIPFFNAIEDAEFLEIASKYHMDLWGLDQEYVYSINFLVDELFNLQNRNDEIILKKIKVDSIIRNFWFKKEKSKSFNIFDAFLKDSTLLDFINQFDSKNSKAIKIIEDLKISWDIYAKGGQESHEDRISYMRNNFIANYNLKLKNEIQPKVFLKFGQAHASKIISNGAFDLGHLTQELAIKNKTISSNFNIWTRYYIDENNEEIDLLKAYTFFNRVKFFMLMAKKHQWTLIDLKSIREDLKKGKIQLPNNGDYHRLNALIQGFDYQLITPLDKKGVPSIN
jgi:hypothetical protein